MTTHPTPQQVDATLDRELPAKQLAELRTHVADCHECGQRYGAWFELEAWAPALTELDSLVPDSAPASPTRPLRGRRTTGRSWNGLGVFMGSARNPYVQKQSEIRLVAIPG